MERRYLGAALAPVAVRKAGDVQTITGYAARFFDGSPETEFRLADDMVERIRPTAFAQALADKTDVRALFDHDSSQLLGRTASGTLKLSTDSKGLRYTITVNPNDPDHQRVVEKIGRGDLSGSSFGFRPTKVTWAKEDGTDVRYVESVDLIEVSVVTWPAYVSTSTSVRAEDVEAIDQERRDWIAGKLAYEFTGENGMRKHRAELRKHEVAAELLERKAKRASQHSHLFERTPDDDNESLRRKLQLIAAL